MVGMLLTAGGVGLRRRGEWLVHRFADGFVMERTRGGVIAARYDDVHAELMTYHEPGDSTSDGIDCVLLQLTYPDGGTWAMAEAVFRAPDVLTGLGERCGAGPPRHIGHRAALDLTRERQWM
ncbi:hypothetical protein GCM10010182_77440 [Actinomadura cremea]|nr:hypothetical protein GCM10010182_77440 [Actinomadura cremea]